MEHHKTTAAERKADQRADQRADMGNQSGSAAEHNTVSDADHATKAHTAALMADADRANDPANKRKALLDDPRTANPWDAILVAKNTSNSKKDRLRACLLGQDYLLATYAADDNAARVNVRHAAIMAAALSEADLCKGLDECEPKMPVVLTDPVIFEWQRAYVLLMALYDRLMIS